MPHIHTQPGQHDFTVSLYVIRRGDAGEWQCLVHLHRKFGVYMPPGGHVELDETVWQAAAHELREEVGYELADLQVLQPYDTLPAIDLGVLQPVPFACATFRVGTAHFHNDLCYGFVAETLPHLSVAADESQDVRWVSLPELRQLQAKQKALKNNLSLYAQLIELAKTWHVMPAETFSCEKPRGNEV